MNKSTRYITVTPQYIGIQRRGKDGKIFWNEYWNITGKSRKRLAIVLGQHQPVRQKNGNGDMSYSKLYTI